MRLRATLSVSFLAGTSIREAVTQAKELAEKLNISYVHFNFNGVSLSISPDADVNKAVKEYKNDPHTTCIIY